MVAICFLQTEVMISQAAVCPRSDCEPASTACIGSSQLLATMQLSKSWSHAITRLEIQNGACRCVQDSLERCQRIKLEERPARRFNSPDETGQALYPVTCCDVERHELGANVRAH